MQKRRISLANRGGFVASIIMNGDGVLLKDKKPDPDFPPAGEEAHIDQGAHERMGVFNDGASVGLFRHEDESVSPYFMEHVTIYPGLYRVRTSLWSFQWDKGEVLPARGTEAARLSVVQLTGDGRGGQHPSYVLGYYDAPSLESKEHELVTWLNHNELIGFNTASLAPVANYSRKGRAMAFTGPGIAVRLARDRRAAARAVAAEVARSLVWRAAARGVEGGRKSRRARAGPIKSPPDWRGHEPARSGQGLVDRARANSRWPTPTVCSRAFCRRPFAVPWMRDTRQLYVAQVEARLKAGDCFETAMRWAYRAAHVLAGFSLPRRAARRAR